MFSYFTNLFYSCILCSVENLYIKVLRGYYTSDSEYPVDFFFSLKWPNCLQSYHVFNLNSVSQMTSQTQKLRRNLSTDNVLISESQNTVPIRLCLYVLRVRPRHLAHDRCLVSVTRMAPWVDQIHFGMWCHLHLLKKGLLWEGKIWLLAGQFIRPRGKREALSWWFLVSLYEEPPLWCQKTMYCDWPSLGHVSC